MPDKTCNDCGYCTYDSVDACYICDVTDNQIERYGEVCEYYDEFIPGW